MYGYTSNTKKFRQTKKVWYIEPRPRVRMIEPDPGGSEEQEGSDASTNDNQAAAAATAAVVVPWGPSHPNWSVRSDTSVSVRD